jgi:hypothetical protein
MEDFAPGIPGIFEGASMPVSFFKDRKPMFRPVGIAAAPFELPGALPSSDRDWRQSYPDLISRTQAIAAEAGSAVPDLDDMTQMDNDRRAFIAAPIAL